MGTNGKLLRESPYPAPGVYFEESTQAQDREFVTGVPAFLGFVGPTSAGGQRRDGFFKPDVLTDSKTVSEGIGKAADGTFLNHAVRGFFENGGLQCVVIRLPRVHGLSAMKEALQSGLLALESFEDVDLICAPDLSKDRRERISLQCDILEHCRESKRFAILDSPPEQRTTLDFEEMAESSLFRA